MQHLKDVLWVDQATRAIGVKFNVYNTNSKLLSTGARLLSRHQLIDQLTDLSQFCWLRHLQIKASRRMALYADVARPAVLSLFTVAIVRMRSSRARPVAN